MDTVQKCRRCGKCCEYITSEGRQKCKYMKDTDDHHCMIFHDGDRIGRIIEESPREIIRCQAREDIKHLVDGCPCNITKK